MVWTLDLFLLLSQWMSLDGGFGMGSVFVLDTEDARVVSGNNRELLKKNTP